MKLAVAIAGSNAIPSAFVVWRGFEESFKKASKLGYDGVELALKTPNEVSKDDLEKWTSKYGVEISCISTGQVYADLGLYFTHPDYDKRKKVVDIFNDFIHIAKDYSGMVNIGRIRGFIPDGQAYENTENLFIDTVSRICETASKYDVDLILEPVNRYEINFINNLDEGAELVNKIGYKNIGLMPDIFHMNIEDAVIEDALLKHSDIIKYIHFADSNRLAPGQGHINFSSIIKSLKKSSYQGWISIEILPKPNPDTAARQAVEYIKPLLNLDD